MEQATIKQIAEMIGKTPQALYSLIKHNEDLARLCEENKVRVKGGTAYKGPVIEYFLDFYKVDGETPAPGPEAEKSKRIEELEAQVEELKKLLEASKEEHEKKEAEAQEAIKAANETLERVNREREEFYKQNSMLLLMLSEERQQVKLLSAPKKSIIQRIKGMFGKKSEGPGQEGNTE